MGERIVGEQHVKRRVPEREGVREGKWGVQGLHLGAGGVAMEKIRMEKGDLS